MQATLASDTHLAQGQFLHQKVMNEEKVIDIPSRNYQDQKFPKPKGRV
jgi:hypothetical protein